MRYTSAGHPSMMLRRHSGAIEELGSKGIPLGMLPGSRYETGRLTLEEGGA